MNFAEAVRILTHWRLMEPTALLTIAQIEEAAALEKSNPLISIEVKNKIYRLQFLEGHGPLADLEIRKSIDQ